MRRAGETRSFQVGETFAAGAMRAACGASSPAPSILGKAEWVRKAAVLAPLSVLGEADLGQNEVGHPEDPRLPPVLMPASLSVLGSADQGRSEVVNLRSHSYRRY
jgi:hypothetical protein